MIRHKRLLDEIRVPEKPAARLDKPVIPEYTCPVCGGTMEVVNCKKVCTRRPNCFYFESCNEF